MSGNELRMRINKSPERFFVSKKRAYVDAILTATCASSVFTQDMEDIVNFQEVNK